MQDPIGSFERIRELFISYLDTAFRIRDESVAEERRQLLRRPGTFTTEPLLEPVPRYSPALHEDGSEVTFDDLLQLRDPNKTLEALNADARHAFLELTLAGLFPSTPRVDGPMSRKAKFAPYQHQIEMLARGTRDGTPGVVTSGTGSGKTEAFLMPVLAGIVSEAKGWTKPAASYLKSRWWHDPATGLPYQRVVTHKDGTKSFKQDLPSDQKPSTKAPLQTAFRPHRAGETRPAAVRALVLYPMNALVEDQLVRLRRALDSAEARAAMDQHLDGNRIFFGRYIGATPVTGHSGSAASPRGLDAFLKAGKKAAKEKGELYFPDHKKSDHETGQLEYTKAWTSELDRRKRRLETLFEHSVDLERAQKEARLHSLDESAKKVHTEQLAQHIRTMRDLLAALADSDFRRQASLLRPTRTDFPAS